MMITIIILLLYITGWMILLLSSSSSSSSSSSNLLFPDSNAAKERLSYALDFTNFANYLNNTNANTNTKSNVPFLKLKIAVHLLLTYLIILPFVSHFWFIDELLYTDYKQIPIMEPLITISCPRAGTTSFHRTIALDTERYVTPTMLELVLPFICVQKVLWFLNEKFPTVTKRIEIFLKYINNITNEVDGRHPISLFSPDADDILLGEWHWISVGSIRTFPIKESWFTNYQMMNQSINKKRSMEFHQIMCQKVLYNRGGFENGQQQQQKQQNKQYKQLLLRSHLSPCIEDFQRLYPDAIIVGIIRNPIEVLRSFAGLSNAAVYASTGINMLQEDKEATTISTTTTTTAAATSTKRLLLWSHVFVDILTDMMGREAEIYGNSNNNDDDDDDVDDDTNNHHHHHQKQKQQQQQQLQLSATTGSRRRRRRRRYYYVTFTEFQEDPLNSIKYLYENALETKVTPKFENEIKSNLTKHTQYKTKHKYHNPTLEEMNINEEQFLSIPNVKKYSELLLLKMKLKKG